MIKEYLIKYFIPFSVLLISFFFTRLLIVIAKKKNILDIPNKRSSHSIPTPRGGGLALLLLFYLIGFIFDYGELQRSLIWIGFLLVGLMGLYDDRYELSSKIRLFFQLLIVTLVLFFSFEVTSLDFLGYQLKVKYIIIAFSVFYVVWILNLYNFMDGIDGIASIQAVTLLVGILTLSPKLIYYHNYYLFLFIFVILGFLMLNWQPARIFMGDVGSASLGFLFGVWAVYSKELFEINFTEFNLLLTFFILDSTITLFRIIISGKKATVAHKSHFYQRAVQSGLQHQTVTIIAGLLSLNSIIGVFFYRNNSIILGVTWVVIPILLFFTYVENRKPFRENV